MFTLRNKSKQSGFTLMELLIVIAILGLLLGLIAPRLGGITASTADNVCDTNNKGIRGMTAMFYEQNARYPSNLTNMVTYTASGAATLVSVENSATVDTEEVISAAFAERNLPAVYAIDADEYRELAGLGVTAIQHHAGWDASADGGAGAARADFATTLTTGSFVMMLGVTAADAAATPSLWAVPAANADATLNTYGDVSNSIGGATWETATTLGNPDWIGRIAMAVNDECELITSGLITASALCPTAVLADGKFSHEEFFIILPRLAATVERNSTLMDGIADHDSTAATPVPATYVDEANQVDGKLMSFHYEAQEGWQFEVACPEGHKWPAADAENWVVNP